MENREAALGFVCLKKWMCYKSEVIPFLTSAVDETRSASEKFSGASPARLTPPKGGAAIMGIRRWVTTLEAAACRGVQSP